MCILWNLGIKDTLGLAYIQLVLFFVERFSSLRGSKCIVGILLEPEVMSFVERSIILCPYLGESTIRGSSLFCKIPSNSVICECSGTSN